MGALFTISGGAAGLYGKQKLNPSAITYTLIVQWIGLGLLCLIVVGLVILGIILLVNDEAGCDGDDGSSKDDDEPNWCGVGKLVGLLFLFLAAICSLFVFLSFYFIRVVTKFREYIKIQLYIRGRHRVPGQVVVGQAVVAVAAHPQQPYPAQAQSQPGYVGYGQPQSGIVGYGQPQPVQGQFYPQAAVGQPIAAGQTEGAPSGPSVVSGSPIVHDSGASPNPPKV